MVVIIVAVVTTAYESVIVTERVLVLKVAVRFFDECKDDGSWWMWCGSVIFHTILINKEKLSNKCN